MDATLITGGGDAILGEVNIRVFRHACFSGFDCRLLPYGRGSDRIIPTRTLRVDGALGPDIAFDVETIAGKTHARSGRGNQQVVHIEDRRGQVALHISATDKAQRILGRRATNEIDHGLEQTPDGCAMHQPWWRTGTWMSNVA